MLNREPMWLKSKARSGRSSSSTVSVLNREPMWLKFGLPRALGARSSVSVLNREPMWLKSSHGAISRTRL